MQAIKETVQEKFQRRREFDHRKMASGIFENHRFVHHSEFEVRLGIVDRDFAVFRNGDDDETDQRQAVRHAQFDVRQHMERDFGKLCRTGDERHNKNDRDHRRLGERREHHLAARTNAAEARADVHAGEREERTWRFLKGR